MCFSCFISFSDHVKLTFSFLFSNNHCLTISGNHVGYINIYIYYTPFIVSFSDAELLYFQGISQGFFSSLDETCHLFHQGETLPRNRREVCEVVGAWHSGVDCAGGGWWRSGGKLTPKSYGPWLFWMLWSWDETTPATKAKNVTWMRSASQIYLLIKSYECIHWTSTFVLLCGFVEGHRNSGKDSEEDWPWELSIWDLAPQYENHYRSKHQPTCANSWMSPTTKGFGPPKWPYIFLGGEDRKTM